MSMRFLHMCLYQLIRIFNQIVTNGLNIFIYTFSAISMKTKRNLLQKYFFAIENQNLMENPSYQWG